MALYCSALNVAQHRLTDWYTRSLDDYDYYFHYYLLSALVRLTLQCRILRCNARHNHGYDDK